MQAYRQSLFSLYNRPLFREVELPSKCASALHMAMYQVRNNSKEDLKTEELAGICKQAVWQYNSLLLPSGIHLAHEGCE
jgi:hypothetical protein